jgi:hypothetical protein
MQLIVINLFEFLEEKNFSPPRTIVGEKKGNQWMMFDVHNNMIGIGDFGVDVCLSHIFYKEKNIELVQYYKVLKIIITKKNVRMMA